jgi:hypothetical protein
MCSQPDALLTVSVHCHCSVLNDATLAVFHAGCYLCDSSSVNDISIDNSFRLAFRPASLDSRASIRDSTSKSTVNPKFGTILSYFFHTMSSHIHEARSVVDIGVHIGALCNHLWQIPLLPYARDYPITRYCFDHHNMSLYRCPVFLYSCQPLPMICFDTRPFSGEMAPDLHEKTQRLRHLVRIAPKTVIVPTSFQD